MRTRLIIKEIVNGFIKGAVAGLIFLLTLALAILIGTRTPDPTPIDLTNPTTATPQKVT